MLTSPLRHLAWLFAAVLIVAGVSACGDASADNPDNPWSSNELTLDFATYSPLSLIIKKHGWLEEVLGDDVTVNWVQSAGSNKANELLRSGSIDIGSTAGSAALLARANGSPIRTIALYGQPEWAALVVAKDSPITSVEQLRGASVAATKGTDPFFFLVQALEEVGVGLDEVELQLLQHTDGRIALENGRVDAWAGLDPMMADTELSAGSTLLHRNLDFNTYGFLNAREEFIAKHPDLAQLVVDAYEKARAWAVDNPEQTAEILAEVAGIDLEVATKVITERTNLGIEPVPGEKQLDVLRVVGPIFVEAGDVSSQAEIDRAIDTIFDDQFAQAADAASLDK